ncbi:MAG: bifunctional folylpolyglutamate synthase/dihydrofolate synthase [Gammaproteobacteria bacterium]|nr:bifunctional folylpolyglutamate synthase/dihydrofolate synthase [Gammaproteobacteria bacterium]
MKRTLAQWLSWQETLNPSEIDLGLERVNQILAKLQPGFSLDKPEHSLPFVLITIGGTNGKGSTIEYLHSILAGAGYKTGVYTSPHFVDYNERIQINHQQISDEVLCEMFEQIEFAREQTQLTYFEFGTLAAIQYFTEQCCDVVILEVGLGGRLDAVNCLDADCALVTTVSLDHQDWLGDNIETIAKEKAGIYRNNKIAIYGDTEVPENILDITKDNHIGLFKYEQDYLYVREKNDSYWNWQHNSAIGTKSIKSLPNSPIVGEIQYKNMANTLMVINALTAKKLLKEISPDTIIKGIINSRLSGRLQIIHNDPLTLLDVAHNEQAALVLKNYLVQTKAKNISAIFSVLKDKDYQKIINILAPIIYHWHVYTLDSPRALSSKKIARVIQDCVGENSVTCYNEFNEAYQSCSQANKTQASADCIIIFGSFLTVSDAKIYFHG